MRATYRLQLHRGFGFAEAASVVDYLERLGVSHLYLSPYLQAAPGSTHGYDVIDHSIVNAELGGETAHRGLVDAMQRLGLRQVVDVVPNHMAIGDPGNRWWWDVLENGPSSIYAEHFDVDWDPPESKVRNRVLLPLLEDHYGRVLDAGAIRLTLEADARFRIRYRDHVLPVSPRSLDDLVLRASRNVDIGSDDLAFIGHSLARLPSAERRGEAEIVTRHRDKEVLHSQLARLTAEVPEVAAAVVAEVELLNTRFDDLDAFLERQNYRLAHWRTAGQEVGYRRFFDINSLVGLRVESENVFRDTHELVHEWLRKGEVDGLRIDHPDGLRDPLAYLALLRGSAPDAWIFVEKILEPGEELPEGWPVEGSTGYDFCHTVTRLLHDPRGEIPLRGLYADLGEDHREYGEVVHSAKHLILSEVLAADVSRLANIFADVAEGSRSWRDFTRRDLQEALVETAACMRVYRTYVREAPPVAETDAAVIRDALAEAAQRRQELDPEVFELLGLVLRAEVEPGPSLVTELRLRFQQLTGPVMAKAVEDTVFYDHVPLVSLNEVGSDPCCFALDPVAVHDTFAEAARRRNRSMLALSTHDTKRSEDVRARIAVLSELPGAWAEAVQRWMTRADSHRAAMGAGPDRPDRRLEYLLFQTMVGAHPLPLARAREYILKAAKEAKRNTSWSRPDEDYDTAVVDFVDGVYTDDVLVEDIGGFAAGVTAPGRVNSLAQKLVQLTAPGVPDIYQGCELWDLSLVDPDNRRPVDFELRSRMLGELPHLDLAGILARSDEGMTKLHVVCSALALRRTRPGWFASQEYRPLPVSGHAAANAFGFLRGGHAATVVCRLPVGLEAGGGWRDTTVELPAGTWFDVIHGRTWPGGEVYVADLFDALPVALLHDDESLGDRAWIEPRS